MGRGINCNHLELVVVSKYCLLLFIFVAVVVMVTVFAPTSGADRFPCSPDIDNHLHAVTSCTAVIGTTRPNG